MFRQFENGIQIMTSDFSKECLGGGGGGKAKTTKSKSVVSFEKLCFKKER